MPARNATIEDLKKAYPTYCVESYEGEQMKTTTICNGCDERISLYGGHVCRKYLEKYSDRTDSGWWNADGTYVLRDRSKMIPTVQSTIDAMNKIPFHIKEEPRPYDYVSQTQKLMDNGMRFGQEFLAKQLGVDIVEEKRKIQEEKRNYICSMCREKDGICECNEYYDEKYKEEMSSQVVETMEKDKFIDGKTTLNSTLIDFNIMHGVAGIDYGKEKSKSIGTISQYWLNGSVKNFSVDWTTHPIYLELKNNINVKCEVDNNGKITGTVITNLYLSEQWFLDFEQRCVSSKDVQSLSSWQNPNFQGLWNFQIQLVGYVVETKHVPQPIYEVGSPKSFYIDCTICNQCDQADIYKPKTENYTCQKCWPR